MSEEKPDDRQAANAVQRNLALGLGLALIILIADQWIKRLVEAYLPFGEPVPVLPFFSLLYTYNTGIAFSLFNDLSAQTLLIVALAVVCLLLLLWWQARKDGLLSSLGFGMILGGAIGNILDRAFLGHVIDYVFLHAGAYSFAIFNLADAALTVGVGFVLLSGLLSILAERKSKS